MIKFMFGLVMLSVVLYAGNNVIKGYGETKTDAKAYVKVGANNACILYGSFRTIEMDCSKRKSGDWVCAIEYECIKK